MARQTGICQLCGKATYRNATSRSVGAWLHLTTGSLHCGDTLVTPWTPDATPQQKVEYWIMKEHQ